MCVCVCVCVCVYIYIKINWICASRNLLTYYFEPNLAQWVWVYSYMIQEDKTSKWLFTFLTCHNWEGSDVCHFLSATSSLKLNSSSILTFLGVCCVVLYTWWNFYCRIACWNNSFDRVAWESKYDGGRTETCKNPKIITNEAILYTV